MIDVSEMNVVIDYVLKKFKGDEKRIIEYFINKLSETEIIKNHYMLQLGIKSSDVTKHIYCELLALAKEDKKNDL